MSTAAYLRAPPAPPNDPRWMQICALTGWRISALSKGIEVAPADGALMLRQLAGSALTDEAGTFGGLVPPSNAALDPDGNLWLLDRSKGLLQRFDCCTRKFVAMPCTGGIGHGVRQLVYPAGIAAFGPNILVADEGPPGRVLVFAREAMALRAIWQPPAGAVANPWMPAAIACDANGRTYVADPANGAIHVFDRTGVWREAWSDFGAVCAIAVDKFGRVYTLVAGDKSVRLSDRNGNKIEQVYEVGAVARCFPANPVAGNGTAINLAPFCDGAGWYDLDGGAIKPPVPTPPVFTAKGTWITPALDSAIARCTWHRLVLEARLPPRTGAQFFTYTSEIELPQAMIHTLPDSSWTAVPAIANDRDEALILSEPGRYLWLKAELTGRGQETPRLCEVKLEYPRITLRRYLPAAFGSDPVSSDFTDRLLAIFDSGFRSVESKIDDQAYLFDARSAPSSPGRAGVPDMLTWLASWIGIAFDSTWPVPRRRRFLRAAAHLYRCRGTFAGLRGMLLLYLGLDEPRPPSRRAACARPCAPAPHKWRPPTLILEHWRVRRWLFLGGSRLGDAAVLWGNSIMGRTQLDVNAQTGITRLDVTRDPERDPFHSTAYAYTAFVPARFGRTARDRNALQRTLDAETPAYVQSTLRFVSPRMRIGIQASIGFDSVVGCWPMGVTLDQAALGKATVLSPGERPDTGPRLGQTSRLGAAPRGMEIKRSRR